MNKQQKFDKDESKTYDLSKLPSEQKPIEFQQSVQKTWNPPQESQTYTMPYGGQVPKMVDVQAIHNLEQK